MTLIQKSALKSKPKTPVLFDHDGSVDDFLSLMLLLSMEKVQLLGISITPADCYADTAFETTCRLLTLSGQENIEVAIGDFYGINAFPSPWRARPRVLNALPSLINLPVSRELKDACNSVDLFISKILDTADPVTIMMTGPCSNLVQALEKKPEIAEKIHHIIWMGGAVDVPGNVVTYNHNGTAEWNIFWDPVSANKLLGYHLSITLVPLDATNKVPVSIGFLKQLALQKTSAVSDLASQFWAITIDTIPSYEYTYFMWDVLATSYLAIPEAFEVERIEIDIISKGPEAGRTIRKKNTGQWVNITRSVDTAIFYQYIFKQFNTMRTVNLVNN